ncbi:MAG TPA: phospholipase D-like domain-containing protein [Polyangiaceae bacterium]|nr:phospholipase D-like domain-containing protein [Polyangiaceae bacterium]
MKQKMAIVDERFVTIGSANLMNRSMRIDHELNVSFDVDLCETEQQKQELTDDIRRLRASLLAEHAGTFELEPFMQTDELVTLVEHLCDDPNAKLKAQELERPKNDDPFFTAICDPSEPLDWGAVYDAVDALFDADQNLLKGAERRVGQRLGVVDVEGSPKRATE